MPIFLRAEFYRWRIRRLLHFLYSITRGSKQKSITPHWNSEQQNITLGFLFSGTYGDFVQVLPVLNFLSHHFSNSTLLLYQQGEGSRSYVKEFKDLLPVNIRQVYFWETLSWIFSRRDLLLTNCVGVYRSSFDLLACLGAQRAYGFRHELESTRPWFFDSVCLNSKVKNFSDENLRLVEKMGIELGIFDARDIKHSVANETIVNQILFHVGAAGLKRDFGLILYAQLVISILKKIESLWPTNTVKVVMGPGDEDIAQMIMSQSKWTPEQFSIAELTKQIQEFTGTLLCFNSFFAHLCFYLKRSAIVIHRESVPYGYDCAPLHIQVLLKSVQTWDLSEVFGALESSRSRQTQFIKL